MRISFIWDWEPSYYQSLTWQDGLAAALKVLMNRGHEIQVLAAGTERNTIKNPLFDIQVSTDVTADVKKYDPDVILHWADTTRPNALPTSKLGKPMALCFAGGISDGDSVMCFKHFFIESNVYRRPLERYGSISIAFGTNTELFKPVPEQPKTFDTIFPATFARWKRHEIYAQAVEGLNNLAVGYMYDTNERDCWQICLSKGTMVLPHVSAETLRYLYAASKVCTITSQSNGGSQRTVLEAMAMNLPLVVCDSDKFDYIKGQDVIVVTPEVEAIRAGVETALTKEVNTRDYVQKNWSEHSYADALEAGLRGLL